VSALTQFQKAIELDPDNVEAYVYLGKIHAEQDRRDEARKLYEKALELDPNHEDVRSSLAQLG
jgi:Flp pilus assembly protein TadD